MTPGMRGWLFSRRVPNPQRNRHIAMVLTSLIAGLLTLVNLDRRVHSASAAEHGYNASEHGWPLVYLQRVFESDLPNHVRFSRSSDWPWPPVLGEIRTYNWIGLAADVTIAAMLLITVYLVVFQLVGWYDLRFGAQRSAPKMLSDRKRN